jgi:ATP-dependent Lon protease
MDTTETLPLFPLPLVVLPGETLALHLYEPRYREMLASCLASPRDTGDFVIVYSDGEQTDPVATAVTITRVLDQQPDGRANILVHGLRRVTLQQRFQLHAYDSVGIEPYNDLGDDWDEELATQVYALHRQVIVLATGDEPPDRFYNRRESLAFTLAACSGLSQLQQRQFLLLRDENARLEKVATQLRHLLPLFQAAIPLWKNIIASYTLAQVEPAE